ncbi:MAG: phosphatidylglycerol lysyltransferase domain-containing protein [Luteolibacter sp.]
MPKRSSAFLLLLWSLLLVVLPIRALADDEEEDSPVPKATIELNHGKAVVRLYEPDESPPHAIFIFGSGDGGWSPWEDTIAQWLKDSGIYVVGFDCREYAASDYDQDTLGKDMAKLAADAAVRCNGADVPVIYGGWSMGAVQAVAAAASQYHSPRLVGVMMLSADSRGRYGLRESDELGLKSPEGPGTFGLSDFTNAVKDLRVAQFHGGSDFMASTAWILTLQSPHTLYTVPGANHGFDGPADSFQEWINTGVEWVLGDDSKAVPPPHMELPYGLSPMWPAAALAIALALFFIFSKKHSIRILVVAMAVMGLADLSESLFTKPPLVMAWMQQWVPLGVTEKSRLLLLISGITLLVLARGLSRRKRIAWWLGLIMLAVSAVLHLSRAFDWHHALAAVVLLVPLIRWRKEFIARSDASSLRLAVGLAAILALGLFIYGAFGLKQFSDRREFGEELSWGDCAKGSFQALLLRHTEYDQDGSRAVRAFLRTLRGGSLLSCFLVLGLMLRPVLQRRFPTGTDEERSKVDELIKRFGGDPMDTFALLPDKRYFFTKDEDGVVAYALWRNFAVALADPICAPEKRQEVIHSFNRFARRQDWVPIFYCAHTANRAIYEEEGFVTFKVGEDARLKPDEFNLQGGKFQNLRTAGNRARKENMAFTWYNAKPSPDHGLEAQMKLVSDNWLDAKHGGEMTFDLGAFDVESIRNRGAGVVRNAEGRVEAFATWLPYKQGTGRTLDLMRGTVEARNGGLMDFLILESINHFRSEGVTEISLGNAPLADVRTEEDGAPNRQEKATRFLFENFDKYYGYKSLFSFKRKYHPDWQGRYLAYPPGTPLPMLGLAIAGVHLPGGFRALLKS